MEKLQYSIFIHAPKQKVWETMLNDDTYRQWTDVFNPGGGSYYEGDWNAGSDIRFIGPEKDGSVSGMISKIKESRPYEFLSIQHLGEIIKGQITMWPTSQESFENYTFKDADGGTHLLIDLDSKKEYKNMFDDLWPKALEKLKELTEK